MTMLCMACRGGSIYQDTKGLRWVCSNPICSRYDKKFIDNLDPKRLAYSIYYEDKHKPWWKFW